MFYSLGELTVDYYIREQDRVQTASPLPEKYRKSVFVKEEATSQPVFESVEESNALINWQKKMKERKLQQGSIASTWQEFCLLSLVNRLIIILLIVCRCVLNVDSVFVYYAELLGKPTEDLVMNQGDKYREKQELRYLIDRSIPAVDYGKGYRVGSEFWQQRPPIGDEQNGLQ